MLIYGIIEYLWLDGVWREEKPESPKIPERILGFSTLTHFTEWLWKDGIWRSEPPEGGFKEKRETPKWIYSYYTEYQWSDGIWRRERPESPEVKTRITNRWVAFSSPHAVTVIPAGQTPGLPTIVRLDMSGPEYTKVTHAKNVKQSNELSDFMVLREKQSGNLLTVNVQYLGFGVSAGNGKFILRKST